MPRKRDFYEYSRASGRNFKNKKEKDICILAHSYQAREICEIADFTGDSYALSVKAQSVPQKP